MDPRGKIALVTGAARRLGRAIATTLGRAGSHIVVHYSSSRQEAEETTAEIRQLGVEVLLERADLGQPEEVDALFDAVGERFGSLDILVNSAASFVRRPFARITVSEWDTVLALNLRAPFLCTQRSAALMAASDRSTGEPGLVVNMVDLSAVQAWPGYAHHGVSKAGLLHLTNIAARELAPEVRVNAIVPGPILPPTGMEVGSDEWHRHGMRVPLQRTGSPEQVGEAILFLTRNDYVTGETIFVDGGEHLVGTGHRADGGVREKS
ncbi:MAG: SDR family oxidoreductase [Acidobacteria bacterium]|nr:MAG: SDR family oxidoreductase [Acidobacteriota bacterium]